MMWACCDDQPMHLESRIRNCKRNTSYFALLFTDASQLTFLQYYQAYKLCHMSDCSMGSQEDYRSGRSVGSRADYICPAIMWVIM